MYNNTICLSMASRSYKLADNQVRTLIILSSSISNASLNRGNKRLFCNLLC